MVPICKSFGSLRLQIERRSGLLNSCSLQSSYRTFSPDTRQISPSRQKKLYVKASTVADSNDKGTADGTAGTMVKAKPDVTVDATIAKALLEYLNAAWTPYHAVGAISHWHHVFYSQCTDTTIPLMALTAYASCLIGRFNLVSRTWDVGVTK